jgi:hypothetical protein
MDIGPIPTCQPAYGEVYTIAHIHRDDDGEFLSLDGFDFFATWYSGHFRPVTSPKQEVSFTTGAPVDSERWDNRVKRKPQKVITALQSQAQQPSQI